ncbi:MAG: hypothetical protein IPJ90_16135 [Anaerolineaceae bacterium]|nr:hypothetical protein [Anaerolineaceae bacterium]
MAISIDSATGNIRAGGDDTDGDLILRSNGGQNRFHLDAGGGNIWIGGNGADGDIILFPVRGKNGTLSQATIHIDGGAANIFAGGNGVDGDLVLKSGGGANRIRLDADGGNIWAGGNGADGDLLLFRANGNNSSTGQATIHLDGDAANIWAGGNGVDGDLVLKSGGGANRIRLDADGGNIWLGGNGADGDIVIFRAGGDNQTLSQASIHLNGDAGDIVLQNADCAEEFEVEDEAGTEPGTVMVIGEHTRLCSSQQAYDRRVAGIVAGAGTLRPGIVLGRQISKAQRLPIALMGRVFARWMRVTAVSKSATCSPLPTCPATP